MNGCTGYCLRVWERTGRFHTMRCILRRLVRTRLGGGQAHYGEVKTIAVDLGVSWHSVREAVHAERVR